MSEVADGEIPPWLLEDDGTNGAHVDAGPRTPALADATRNNYPIPDPTESASSTSARQNQPALASAQDEPIVETPTAGIDPLSTTADSAISGTAISGAGTTHTTATPPQRVTPIASTGSKKPGKKTGKGGKQPKEPTMVVYKVRPGDNLSDIAKRSNTTVSQIMRDSKLKSTTIHPGQTIKVRYTPKGYKAGKGNGTKSSGKTHTVTSGQTLSGIASRYGVSTSQLMKANGLTEADAKKIRPGQKLTIPSKSSKR